MSLLPRLALIPLLVLAACRVDAPAPDASADGDRSTSATMLGDDTLPTAEQIEAARLAGRGRAAVDTTGRAAAARANPERLDQIGADADWAAEPYLPLGGGDIAGPSVLKAQVLLSRAGFSPGEIDGRWGDNTELAVLAAQRAAGLPRTGLVDDTTLRALRERASASGPLVDTHVLTADDVAGPFRALPADVYERARLDALGFESLGEKLGERFHAAPALLERLNPGRRLDALAAGDSIRVPAVDADARPGASVARIVVFKDDGVLQALAEDGRVVFHAPVTVGASYDPSPDGAFSVTRIAPDPTWHYQPAILASVPDDQPDAVLPPGPNNAVGRVWIALSEPHYGIHGTSAPSTIGAASSAGCVRLTNWDALRLADLVRPGVPVQFRATMSESGTTGARDTPPRADA